VAPSQAIAAESASERAGLFVEGPRPLCVLGDGQAFLVAHAEDRARMAASEAARPFEKSVGPDPVRRTASRGHFVSSELGAVFSRGARPLERRQGTRRL